MYIYISGLYKLAWTDYCRSVFITSCTILTLAIAWTMYMQHASVMICTILVYSYSNR